jgi:alkanesulfonate monooxygenase SsuD/methylene tetrahydromethanopterin reductase-like flavin-dependent oxidoreductase (luciferase family)
LTRFGYCFEAPTPWPEMLELALWMDRESNFDSLWIADSLMPNGPPDEPKLEAWTALAAIAQATTRLRLGLLVAANPFRPPALTAKIVTTLDHISGGRVELGIGAGWPERPRRFGIEAWTRKERAERFGESLEVIKLLWTQERPRFKGTYHELDEPPYSPPNVQQPHPPILIGGGSDTMLRLAARYADAVSPMIDINVARSKFESYCDEIGRDPSSVRWIGGGWLFLNDDPAIQRRALDAAVAQYGDPEEEIRRGGLFGSVDDVTAGVQRQIDDGCSDVIIFQLPKVHAKSLARFSDEVIASVAR